jgi:hypothetical protein
MHRYSGKRFSGQITSLLVPDYFTRFDQTYITCPEPMRALPTMKLHQKLLNYNCTNQVSLVTTYWSSNNRQFRYKQERGWRHKEIFSFSLSLIHIQATYRLKCIHFKLFVFNVDLRIQFNFQWRINTTDNCFASTSTPLFTTVLLS